jgi:pectinesterase
MESKMGGTEANAINYFLMSNTIMKPGLLFFFISFYLGKSFSQTGNPQLYKYVFTVAKDGSGDFLFIQDAINAIRVYPLAPITLYIKNGVYNEKIELPTNNTDVTIIGENADSTIVIFNDYSGKGKHTTFTSFTAKISGNRFRAENITFANSAGQVGQALALYVDADKAVFKNCKFLGNQDTIFSSGEGARQLFINCFIEGTTDFIFGPSTAVFQDCTIRCKSNSFITAANTPKAQPFGFVFRNCKIIADPEVTKLYLGRPWRAFSKTVFINCDLPKAIVPEGWDNWGNAENEKTVFYAEYKNFGDGAVDDKRVKWSKLLTEKEAKRFTLATIFSFNNKTGVTEYRWFDDSFAKPFDRAAFVNKPPLQVPLYKNAVPNSKQVADKESFTVNDNVTRITKVSVPSITIYKPQKQNGMAVIICPGGGYAVLAFDKEGTRIAREMNRWGVTCFVLKYRLPDDSSQIDKSLAPLQDAQQAIRFVKSNAKEFGIAKDKIGIMGFSAGGHLASTAATHFTFRADINNSDTTSVRPDFAVLIYPVISFDSSMTHKGSRNNLIGAAATAEQINFFSNELQVTTNSPPAFLVHTGDDMTVPVENSLRYYRACIKNKVPTELHLYPKGGHGFGLYNNTTEDNWMERLKNWLYRL